jgi:hypothetical protein
MAKQELKRELQRALARPDSGVMAKQIDAYIAYDAKGGGEWPDEHADDFSEIISCVFHDPEKALAYVVIAAARTDNAEFLALMGCSNLEDVLREPSAELLGRIAAEARRSARFGWLLSHPFKGAISKRAWEAIKQFRITGPREEPPLATLPPRDAER